MSLEEEALQTTSCKAQSQENEGGEDRKQTGGTAAGDGRGLAAMTSWRQLGTGIVGGCWCTSDQSRPYGHLGYGIGEGEGEVVKAK